ncbi:hypothetical protein V7161_10900 [Neobacillus drentensis]|uniref:hypothetical protein n=1 Tax=Neobacillus drentensis TaxID=220684 RepID=UPI002FFEB01A
MEVIDEVTEGSLNLEEDEISDCMWKKVYDLVTNKNKDLREPSVLKQIIDNLIKENSHPINMYNNTTY